MIGCEMPFENNENNFSEFKEISALPSSDMYISQNRLYSWYSEDWGFKYESESKNLYDAYGYRELYRQSIIGKNG